MDEAEIGQRIERFLRKENPSNHAELTPTTELMEGWLVDSLALLSLVSFFENDFDIAVKRRDINARNFSTLEHLVEFVKART